MTGDRIEVNGKGIVEHKMENHVLVLDWNGRTFRRTKMFLDKVSHPFHGYLPAIIADSEMEGSGAGRHHGLAAMTGFCLTICCVFQKRYPDMPRKRVIEFANILLDLTEADIRTDDSGTPAYIRFVDKAWEKAKANGWLLSGCDKNAKWMLSKAGIAEYRKMASPVKYDKKVVFSKGGKFIHICGHGMVVFDTDNPDDYSFNREELLFPSVPCGNQDISRLLHHGDSGLVDSIIECAKGEKQAEFPVMGIKFGADPQTVKDTVMFVRSDLDLDTECARIIESSSCFMTCPRAREIFLGSCVKGMDRGWGKEWDKAIPVGMIVETARNHHASNLEEDDLDFVGSGPGGETRFRKALFNCLKPGDLVKNEFGKRMLGEDAIREGRRILENNPDIIGDIPWKHPNLLDIANENAGFHDRAVHSKENGMPDTDKVDWDNTAPEASPEDFLSRFCQDRGYVVREGGRNPVEQDVDSHLLSERRRDRVLLRELDGIRSIQGRPDNRCLATGRDLTDSISPDFMETMGSERQCEYHHLQSLSQGERELPLAKAIIYMFPLGPEAHDKTHRHIRLMKAAGVPVDGTVESSLGWVAPALRAVARDTQVKWLSCVFTYLARVCGLSADEARKWILDENVWPEGAVQAAFELSRVAA